MRLPSLNNNRAQGFVDEQGAMIILHITTRDRWARALEEGVYRSDSLETQGFIHCSTREQVIRVANALYSGQQGLLLLYIDTRAVRPAIVWEGEGDEKFPHIYGPLHTDAVVDVLPFELGEGGNFQLPTIRRSDL